MFNVQSKTDVNETIIQKYVKKISFLEWTVNTYTAKKLEKV